MLTLIDGTKNTVASKDLKNMEVVWEIDHVRTRKRYYKVIEVRLLTGHFVVGTKMIIVLPLSKIIIIRTPNSETRE